MKKVVFIIGTGHCGSTLLDLLLGSHSNITSLGEINQVAQKAPLESYCNICEGDCKVWTSKNTSELHQLFQVNLMKKILRKIGVETNPYIKFYQLLFKNRGTDILVDSSKNPNWIRRNGSLLRSPRGAITPILIYLSRDGRAVVNSYFRKYPEHGLEHISNNWNQKIERINNCYDSWPSRYKIHVRYEDLALDPQNVIKIICSFLNIGFEQSMLRFWEHDHHIINGNNGTKSLLLKYKNQHKFQKWVEEKNKEHYLAHELGIKFDERWKVELNEHQIGMINSIIGKYNSSIRYEPSNE
jgi:hypothetical protein